MKIQNYQFRVTLSKLKQYLFLPFHKYYIAKNARLNCVPLKGLPQKSPITVFWTIDAGITSFFISECILAKTLSELNHEVLLIRCHKNLKRCTVMDSVDAKADVGYLLKERICATCTKNSIHYTALYDLPTIDIQELIPKQQLKNIIQELETTSNLTEYAFEGLNFGKIALGEVFRTRKLYDSNLSFDEKEHVKNHIIGSISNYLAFKFLKQAVSINRVVYFGDYGSVLGVIASAKQSGIPATNLSYALINNVQRNKLLFGGALSTQDQFNKLNQWEKFKHTALTAEEVDNIGNDLLNRFSKGGFTIYSPLKSTNSNQLYSLLNIDTSQKLLVAFTSSLDEAEATNLQYKGLNEHPLPTNNPFTDQIEWLKALIEFSHKNELQLIVRIHPREGTDGFQVKLSKHLLQLQTAFKTLPQNVKFIWPSENISSYDLAELADLILISWTSVGLEMARLGAPVIAAFQYCPYPKEDVVIWASGKTEYFEKIIMHLKNPHRSLQHILYAFRWFNLVRLGSVIDISDLASNEPFVLPSFKMPKNADKIEEVLIKNKSILDINYEKVSNDNNAEIDAIKRFLKKAVWYFFTGILTNRPLHFLISSQEKVHTPENYDGLIEYKDNEITLRTSNRVITKKSPLIMRMLHLLA